MLHFLAAHTVALRVAVALLVVVLALSVTWIGLRSRPTGYQPGRRPPARRRRAHPRADRSSGMTSVRLTLGEQIGDRRRALGLSQMALANLIGTTQGAISGYETGERQPRRVVLEQLADALDCDLRLVPRGGAA